MDKNYILHKYLNGDASVDEIDLLKASPEYKDYLKLADTAAGFETPAFNAEENYNAILDHRERRLTSSPHKPLAFFLKIAAVFLLVAVGYVFVSSLETSVHTQIAEKKTIILPDNSKVELNAGSSISYSKRKWEEDRSLALKGEAYFKVNKGSKFQVKTDQGIVSVLGTQFNVYTRGNSLNVKCFEGLVSVAFNDTVVKLSAGNSLVIQNDALIRMVETSDTQPSWTLNESSFENADLASVLDELKRQYPVQIEFSDSIGTIKFSGSFPHKNIQTALQSICDPLRLGYTVNGNVVSIYAK
jgi:ferric-dicitrate binding protein FerR (iron transport regulator)